jgi:hypothetical protein
MLEQSHVMSKFSQWRSAALRTVKPMDRLVSLGRGFDVLYFGNSFSRFHLFNIYIYYIHILCMYIYIVSCIIWYYIYMYIIFIYYIWYYIYIHAQLGIQVVVLEFGIPTCEGWFGKGLLFSLGTVGSKQRGWLSLKWLDLAHPQRLIEYKQFPKLGRRQYPNIFLNNKMYPPIIKHCNGQSQIFPHL